VVSKVRAQRIGDRIREELSVILITHSSDPRLAGVYVTAVELDRELEFATVYVSAVEGAARSKEILEGLQHAQGFLRTELARRIVLRMFPRLRFRWDTTYERADKIEQLFTQIHEQEEAVKNRTNGDSPSQDQRETALDEEAEAGADE
jgi:ribosome-binding factor A